VCAGLVVAWPGVGLGLLPVSWFPRGGGGCGVFSGRGGVARGSEAGPCGGGVLVLSGREPWRGHERVARLGVGL